MEMDDSPSLVLGNLEERHLGHLAQGTPTQPNRGRDLTPQIDGQPSPQVTGVRVEQHRTGVVITLRAEGAARSRIALAMAFSARHDDAMRARLSVAADPASQRLAVAA